MNEYYHEFLSAEILNEYAQKNGCPLGQDVVGWYMNQRLKTDGWKLLSFSRTFNGVSCYFDFVWII